MRVGTGLILFYLGTLNAFLALNVGTCTQGDATRLWGGVLSAILYALACIPLWKTSRPGLALALLAPAALFVIGETTFGFRLMAGSSPACDLLENTTGYPIDGNEATYAAIWLGLSAVGWLAVGLVVSNLIRRARHTEERQG